MQITIRPLEPSDDLEIDQLQALEEALDEHAYGGIEAFTREQVRARIASTPFWDAAHWVAVAESLEGGESIVGRASTMMPLEENLETIHVHVAVHPAFRGRGVATALVEEALLPAIRTSGRTLVEAYGEIPADGDADDPALPPNRLAARLGISRKNLAVCRAAPLPVPEDLLDALQAQAGEKLGEYRIELWTDAVPEQHLEAYGVLLHQLELDDPDEDVEHEAPEYTPERIRVKEKRRRDSGVSWIAAIAIAPDGKLAGNSEVEFHAAERSSLAMQENTLVMPAHRGHRLGLALKVATHRELGDRAPQMRSILTWNSHVNPWMIAINEQLGYRVVQRELVLQGRPGL